jgi:hypothetical protein
MQPVRDVDVEVVDPDEVQYWVPRAADLADEGFGLYIHDVYPLPILPILDVRALISFECDALDFLIGASSDEVEYENLAQSLELLPDVQDEGWSIPDSLLERGEGLYGLELGVSGLSHALAARGFHPVASCRSHFEYSWSDCPVVMFACEKKRLERLMPLCESSGCGVGEVVDRGRPLFSVYAKSVAELIDLASRVANYKGFAAREPARTDGRGERIDEPPENPTLFNLG